MPKISVIVTCYNYGEFIKDSVESVLKQTFRDFELIVVNDGSTDGQTLKILEDLKRDHKELIIWNQDNGGPANAKNSGIRISSGEYFLPLDADDKIHPEMLEKCLLQIENNGKTGFVYTYTKFFGNFDAVLVRQEYNFADLLRRNYIVVSSLIRKKAWEDVGMYDENMKNGYEDWEFFIRLGKNGWFGKLIKEPLFFYREHGDSKNKEATRKHESNLSYIRKKHADIYGVERLGLIKKEWKKTRKLKYLNPSYHIERFRIALFILKRYGFKKFINRIYAFFRNQS
jgi:glycosyltransferase involved in cell wall biosynthesis